VKILNSLKPSVVVLIILALALTALPLSAEEKNPDKKAMESNLHIISDEMIAEQSKSMVEFIGNVKATREDSILLAESVKVFFHTSDTKKEGQSNVKQIVATGNVEYTAGERKAFADKAVYTAGTEVLVLTGEAPKLLTGKSWVTGKKITLYRLEERVMVESDGKNRVQAFFDSQDQNQPTSKKKDE
jgi:lipopolysaccharide export system protein LptA